MAKLSASSQDYIEAILALSTENATVRSIDIAERLGVSRASVSRALGVLKNAGLIEQERYGSILLTHSGEQVALEVIERHTALKTFLIQVLGVENEIAEQDACKMEHNISSETLEKLKDYIEKNSFKEQHEK